MVPVGPLIAAPRNGTRPGLLETWSRLGLRGPELRRALVGLLQLGTGTGDPGGEKVLWFRFSRKGTTPELLGY